MTKKDCLFLLRVFIAILLILFIFDCSCDEDSKTQDDIDLIDSNLKDVNLPADTSITDIVNTDTVEDIFTEEDTGDIVDVGGDTYDVIGHDVIFDTRDIGDIKDSVVDVGEDAGCNMNCGDNASCIDGSCVCNQGYWNCNNDWSDGCESNSLCNGGNHLWSKSFGGADNDLGYSASVDNSGNLYLTGFFRSSTINFGGGDLTSSGSGDIFLAKFKP